MLRSTRDMQGYIIQATDGDMGEVYDFYFDDESWTIRYLVVETGNWLSGRRVLLSPAVLGRPDSGEERMPVSLSRRQVQDSPQIDPDASISRLKEKELSDYYGWPAYWGGEGTHAGPAEPAQTVLTEPQPQDTGSTNLHLHSVRRVIGYYIQASDGEIGHVQDFILDDESWSVRYAVVDTRNWWPGKQVLLSPQWVTRVSWQEERVYVDLTRDSVRNSPEFENLAAINRDYENRLYEHYRRRKYWT